MDLLRFATAGSVDDGKSTLIGRLLLDSKSIFEDQLEAVEATSVSKGYDYTDLALLTDGLRSEREQGITIDVAYRYFATPNRKFIIADTPGHVQYTRNMVTGASTADLGLVLVDARQGLTEQSRRHAVILSLLRVPHLVLASTRWTSSTSTRRSTRRSTQEFTQFATKLNIPDLEVIPISALSGDNVVNRSENMPWYQGPTLMHHLEHVHVASDRDLVDARFPVQYVVRPKSDEFHDYRGYAGQVAGGVLKPGDEVVVLPSGMTSKIAGIDLFDQEIDRGVPADVGHRPARGRRRRVARRHDRPGQQRPEPSQDIDAMVCWMTTAPLRPRQKLAIKHTTRTGPGAGQGHPVPPGRQHPAPRPGDQGARPQRDRPRPAAHHGAAAVRPLLEEPHHRVVHPDRRGDRRHRRRRHDQPTSFTADSPG
jgi:sulfate adenylyltransferase large subunit